jgi:hypothetical protein
MRMYGAMLLAALALVVWPDRNILEVPFSQLTLGLIGKTIFFLFVGYWALQAVFLSLAKDNFWPWRWTKRVVTLLVIRAAIVSAISLGAWAISEHKKFGPWAQEYPMISLIILFIAITIAVCMPDDELLADQPESKADTL